MTAGVGRHKWPNDIEEPVHFSNAQWAVTGYGIECLEDPYPIEARRLLETGHRQGITCYDWPVHMAEKCWVDVQAFHEAFVRALDLHKGAYPGRVDPDMLARTTGMVMRIDRERAALRQ